MAFDFDMIKKVYSNIVKNVEDARRIVNKPLNFFRENFIFTFMESHTKIF